MSLIFALNIQIQLKKLLEEDTTKPLKTPGLLLLGYRSSNTLHKMKLATGERLESNNCRNKTFALSIQQASANKHRDRRGASNHLKQAAP